MDAHDGRSGCARRVPDRPLRVLHVDTAREWRGGQTQLLYLASAGPPCAVALPPDAPLRPALEARGVEVLPVDFRGAWWGSTALRRAARDHGADLLAAHTSHAHGHALRAGLPVVVHRRVDFPPSPVSRRKYARPLGYVAVSGAVREVLAGAGVPRDRVAVVHDAVEPTEGVMDPVGLRDELGWPRDARVLLALGALVDHKGHRWLVEAMHRLPDAHLLVAGEGPLRRTLEALAAPLGRRVRWVGRRSDVPRLLRSVDLLVHPSTGEGMGQAVVEALLAGLPVVASAVGGLPEVVRDLGWLVPPRDPAALACAIRRALADPEARRRVEAARDVLRWRHGVPRLVERTHAAYQALLAGHPVDRAGAAG